MRKAVKLTMAQELSSTKSQLSGSFPNTSVLELANEASHHHSATNTTTTTITKNESTQYKSHVTRSAILVVDLQEEDDSSSHAKDPSIIDLTDNNENEMTKVVAKARASVPILTRSRRNNKKRKHVKMIDNHYDCTICLEENIQGWRGYTLSQCHHKYCLVCLSNHIKSSSKTDMIKCPECFQTLHFQDIQSILTAVGEKMELERFSIKANTELLEKEIIESNYNDVKNLFSGGGKATEDDYDNEGTYFYHGMETTRRCPSEHCNYIFIYEPRNPEFQEGTRFDCPQCQNSYCLQCGANNGQVGPSHDNLSCYDRREQLRKEIEERRKFEEWKKENDKADARFRKLVQSESARGVTKPCPRCKFFITKNGGCNHMHCSQCGLDFNWSRA